MTNREHFLQTCSEDEFDKIWCNTRDCYDCQFFDANARCEDRECYERLNEWFKEEYVEPLPRCPNCGGKMSIGDEAFVDGLYYYLYCPVCCIRQTDRYSSKYKAIHEYNNSLEVGKSDKQAIQEYKKSMEAGKNDK
jgi:hypothetical protein